MAVVPKVIYISSVWINLHIQWDENPNVHLYFFGRNEKADPETYMELQGTPDTNLKQIKILLKRRTEIEYLFTSQLQNLL